MLCYKAPLQAFTHLQVQIKGWCNRIRSKFQTDSEDSKKGQQEEEGSQGKITAVNNRIPEAAEAEDRVESDTKKGANPARALLKRVYFLIRYNAERDARPILIKSVRMVVLFTVLFTYCLNTAVGVWYCLPAGIRRCRFYLAAYPDIKCSFNDTRWLGLFIGSAMITIFFLFGFNYLILARGLPYKTEKAKYEKKARHTASHSAGREPLTLYFR